MFPPTVWGDRRRMRIGLLGGSFNPAHKGHRYISLEAKRALRLTQIWWIVSPQNPLKSCDETMPVTQRLKIAREISKDTSIKVTSVEGDLNTQYTWKTISTLKVRFPNAQFVWLMGADNLSQIAFWQRWQVLFRSIHIAVFSRSPYSMRSLFSKAALRYSYCRRKPRQLFALGKFAKPVWSFVSLKTHPESSTRIRTSRKV